VMQIARRAHRASSPHMIRHTLWLQWSARREITFHFV